ncbi:MAG: hypothetical protein V1722_01090 [Candidatus Micrarchaeota archaeon]
MANLQRVEFSAPTKLVLAELDTSVPHNPTLFAELVERKLIFPTKRPGVYAIPFRAPGVKTGTQHKRSIHTLNLPNGQFAFKGTGEDDALESYRNKVDEHMPEREFHGGARSPSIIHVVRILNELHEHYHTAKTSGDPVVNWAAAKGIDQLPTIQHTAVFRPLQVLSSKTGKLQRIAITPKYLSSIRLGAFAGQERVYVYKAKEPTRVAEPLERATSQNLRELAEAGNEEKIQALKQFITRGVLLAHVAHQNKICLTEIGSSLSGLNSSAFEFFDFGTARRYKDEGAFKTYRERDYFSLGHAIEAFAFNLANTKGTHSLRNLSKNAMRLKHIFSEIRHRKPDNLASFLDNEVDKLARKTLEPKLTWD